MSTRTPSAAAAPPTARRSAAVLLLLTVAAMLGGLATAAPAAAVDDPSKPDARVTHGPSCHPGGVVVEVTGGSASFAVTFATTRLPEGEDSAEVGPGQTVVLRTGDVAWSETIDGRLEYIALDGSGASFVDELAGYTFTRPAQEDCAVIAAPAAAATVPPTVPGSAAEAPATVAEKVVGPGTATSVDLVEAAAGPAAVASASWAPLFAAAVALCAATAGLGGVLSRARRSARPPTASA